MQTPAIFFIRIAACWAALTALTVIPATQAQEPPFLGAWKLDTTDIEEQLKKAGMDANLVRQRIARLEQMQWIFGEDTLTTVRDGFPDSRKWKLQAFKDNRFQLQFHKDENTEDAVIVMQGSKRMRLEFPGAGGPPFQLIWRSDQQSFAPPEALAVGSKAPKIDVAHWLNKTQFSGSYLPGKAYLVEFWASWCPPCVAGMANLARLREEFPTSDAAIIAISSETKDTVTQFLARNSPGEDKDPPTLAEITREIAVGADPDGSAFGDYMVAAKMRAIPTAFIIGKTGHVEWIGMPHQVEPVLRKILADDWDRQKFAKVFAGRQHVYASLPKLSSLVSRGENKQALKLIEELLPLADETTKQNLRRLREQIGKANSNK